MSDETGFLEQAIRLAHENVAKGGRPFGAALVKDGAVIATGVNEILATGDPTAHAELLALRGAALAVGSTRLDGCHVYASGHPCPMCLAAIYMAGIRDVTYAYSNEEGEPYGLSTASVYDELIKPLSQMPLRSTHKPVRLTGIDPYEAWARLQRQAGAG